MQLTCALVCVCVWHIPFAELTEMKCISILVLFLCVHLHAGVFAPCPQIRVPTETNEKTASTNTNTNTSTSSSNSTSTNTSRSRNSNARNTQVYLQIMAKMQFAILKKGDANKHSAAAVGQSSKHDVRLQLQIFTHITYTPRCHSDGSNRNRAPRFSPPGCRQSPANLHNCAGNITASYCKMRRPCKLFC